MFFPGVSPKSRMKSHGNNPSPPPPPLPPPPQTLLPSLPEANIVINRLRAQYSLKSHSISVSEIQSLFPVIPLRNFWLASVENKGFFLQAFRLNFKAVSCYKRRLSALGSDKFLRQVFWNSEQSDLHFSFARKLPKRVSLEAHTSRPAWAAVFQSNSLWESTPIT